MATSYATPGIYIEEHPSGSMPIQGVGTAIAAFVGFTATYVGAEGDPTDPDGVRPQLVTSWPQYERIYGGFAPGAMLPYAVRGYFDNGGTMAYIVRASGGGVASPPSLELTAASNPDLPSITVEATADDTAGYEVEVVPPPTPAEGESAATDYSLRVFRNGDQVEEVGGLDFGKSPKVLEKTINDQATTIRVRVRNVSGVGLAERAPAAGRYALTQNAPAAAEPAVLAGSEAERTGYEGLAIADDVTIVAVPDLVTVTTRPDGSLDMEAYLAFQAGLADWAAASGKRMAILDPPPGLTPTGAAEWRDRLGKDTAFAVSYYPNVVVPNRSDPSPPNAPRFLTVPPSGHLAGIWARTDAVRGVHKAPGNEEIRGVVGLETPLTDGEQALLNPIGVNCLRNFGTFGIRVWGARTLAMTDPSWRYVNVRRLFNYMEESIRRGTRWAVFEPNDVDLWQRVKRNVGYFLRGLWMQGALVGATPDQAYFVICDETNNPPSSVAEGKLVVEIGVCPSRPAEFIVFRISQWQSGESTTE
ncbi:MAG: phage tail sheath family protein [Propionibacteriaceae bacterium]|nr:phage tail sheath family protein [Propionibacteriaceae bacterium]